MSPKSSLNRRRLILLSVVMILLVIAVIYSAGSLNIAWPTAGRISRLQQEVKQLHQQHAQLKVRRQKLEQTLRDTMVLSDRFWKTHGNVRPMNRIQTKISQLGRLNSVRFSKLGQPRITELNDNIEAVDIHFISSKTSIHALSRFLREIETHRPQLEWHDLTIRPNSAKSPTSIIVSGHLRAYVLTAASTKVITSKVKR